MTDVLVETDVLVVTHKRNERRWVLLKIPRGDTDELGEEQ